MIAPGLIPSLDPNPLPAPYWVFKLLLLVTFVLHIIAMNFLLGGGVLALCARWGYKNRAAGDRVFLGLSQKLPVLLPATVTLGVAPLLFVQVLYGQFFYTSSVLMAWPWFLVLVFLTAAYYGFYYVSYRGALHVGRARRVTLFSVILVFLVGFMYSNNFTLAQTPSHWAAKYFAHPSGWNLNLAEPTLIPRFLHFFVSAVALGGLFLVFLAVAHWKRDRDYARQLFDFGGKAFLYATMAQFVVGAAFLISLPRNLRMLFLGDNLLTTALFLVGLVGSIAALLLMSNAVRTENLRLAALVVPSILAVVIASMAVMRDILRDAYLQPYFNPGQFTIKTQWAVLPLFLVLFLAGVALWLLMLKRYGLFSAAKPTESRPAVLSGSR